MALAKYEFFASCREDQQAHLAKVDDRCGSEPAGLGPRDQRPHFLMSDLGKASARQLINSRNVFQTSIPHRTARNKNMGGGLSFDRAIEAPGRHDQQSPIHLNTRNR